jgi:DNA-directed RNA polymerase specialized sigma24 family protein
VSHDAARVEVERLYRVEGARLWRAVFAWSGDSAVADDAVAEASTRTTSMSNRPPSCRTATIGSSEGVPFSSSSWL